MPPADPADKPPFGALSIPSDRILFTGAMASFTAFLMSTAVQGVVAFELVGTNSAVGNAVFGQGLGLPSVLHHLVIGSFVIGSAFAFLGPARQATVVDLVPLGMRANAMALNDVANPLSPPPPLARAAEIEATKAG